MKYRVLVFFLCMSLIYGNLHSSSEQVKYYVSAEINVNRQGRLLKILGERDNAAYFLLQKDTHFRLLVIDKNHPRQIEIREIETLSESSEVMYEDAFFLSGNTILFYHVLRKNMQTHYYAIVSQEGRIIEKNSIREQIYRKRKYLGKNEVKLSPDSSKILIVSHLPFEKENNEKVVFYLYSASLQKVWEKELSFPVRDQDFYFLEAFPDNEGNVFFLVKYKNSEDKDPVSESIYSLFTYDHRKQKLEEWVIHLPDKWITDLTMLPDRNGHLVLTGFYSLTKSTHISGVFYLKFLFSDSTATQTTLHALDKQVIMNFYRNERAKQQGLPDMILKNVLLDPNNNLYLISEQEYSRRECYTDYRTGNMFCNDLYYYNDILCIAMDSMGNIKYMTCIQKEQQTMNDGGHYSSFALMYHNGLHFIYHDHEKNYHAPFLSVKPMINLNRAVTLCVSLDEKGNKEVKKIFDSRNNQFTLTPRMYHQISSNCLALIGWKGINTFRVIFIEMA